MGNRKLGVKWVPILVLVLMMASNSLAICSRKCLRATISENRETQGMQVKESNGEFGNGAKELSRVDNSDRLVPTGANPLHHNRNPIKH